MILDFYITERKGQKHSSTKADSLTELLDSFINIMIQYNFSRNCCDFDLQIYDDVVFLDENEERFATKYLI
ncbi:hypothetical protein H5410_004048, partial [Solanum commersonii]